MMQYKLFIRAALFLLYDYVICYLLASVALDDNSWAWWITPVDAPRAAFFAAAQFVFALGWMVWRICRRRQ